VVAVVQGRALAGGCGLATACDIVLAHENAQFGYPEVHLGFVPAMVMAILRRKVPEALAFELLARGDRIDAREAARIGLANHVFPADTFGADVIAYLTSLAERPSSALELTKRLFYGLDGTSVEQGIARGAEVNAIARLTEACKEGVRKFLERSTSQPRT
jgi:methylglutaconyl-CoA hydratase